MSTNQEFAHLTKLVADISQRRPEKYPGDKGWTDEAWAERLAYYLREVYRAGARAQLSRGFRQGDDAWARVRWLADQGFLAQDVTAVLAEAEQLRERSSALRSSYGVTDSDIASMLAEGFHTAFRKAIDHPYATVIHKLISDLNPDEWEAVVRFVADPLTAALRRAQAEHEDDAVFANKVTAQLADWLAEEATSASSRPGTYPRDWWLAEAARQVREAGSEPADAPPV